MTNTNDIDPAHHIDASADCEVCGACWWESDKGGREMIHFADCTWFFEPCEGAEFISVPWAMGPDGRDAYRPVCSECFRSPGKHGGFEVRL
jgi:hypothetical protein